MQKNRLALWGGMIVTALVMAVMSTLPGIAQDAQKRGTILTLDGPVTPPAADYLSREIAAASTRGEEVIILEIDTPGGLVDSMKTIIKSILASDTPVVTYVYPQGARSASAGLYIMYGSHVAAMAPYTNTGSATPIQMGGTGEEEPTPVPTDGEEDAPNSEMTEEDGDEAPVDVSNEASMRGKIIEDSVAYIRGLAIERGRNAEWAEKAVRPPSASITSREALELGVIEIVAEDLDDLMAQLDGRTVQTASGEKTLSTADVLLTRIEPTMLEKVFGFFANPNVAAILFTLGTTGLIVELWNPGSVFPGTVGAVSLLLAFYSFQVLPFDQLKLGLMILGMVLIAVEIFTPTFGLVGLAGISLFGFGLYTLFPEDLRVNEGLLAGSIIAMGILLVTVALAVIRSRGHGPLIGQEAIRRREGRVEDWDADTGEGFVIVDGERWRARSKEPLQPEERIRVVDVDGIVLIIKRAAASGSGASRLLQSFRPQRSANS
ncbi:nodulation protein NfeD [Parvularcula sp. LCG005]|uniref:NfeD family protein n=1 Tax=Parvularcula sp. LCG005 TaxID=3078805 RepID=UPI00294284CF|nr:nodulation protein NfeD [Parvularcula sp. LCG005]WOI54147.1 nodulation protein NfeD [Parvularcula sp. LCG005]